MKTEACIFVCAVLFTASLAEAQLANALTSAAGAAVNTAGAATDAALAAMRAGRNQWQQGNGRSSPAPGSGLEAGPAGTQQGRGSDGNPSGQPIRGQTDNSKGNPGAPSQGQGDSTPASTPKDDNKKSADTPVQGQSGSKAAQSPSPSPSSQSGGVRPSGGPVPGAKPNPESVAAWRDYVSKCNKHNYDPEWTQPSTCAMLSGNLCNRTDVKCTNGVTYFLDANGNVVGRGYNQTATLAGP